MFHCIAKTKSLQNPYLENPFIYLSRAVLRGFIFSAQSLLYLSEPEIYTSPLHVSLLSVDDGVKCKATDLLLGAVIRECGRKPHLTFIKATHCRQ
jgi:hypothetical protein